MRKYEFVTIEEEGRDKGKVFKITEMSAFQAEKWAARAFLAIAKSGAEISEDQKNSGLAGLAGAGLQLLSGLVWEAAEPLLDEMLTCVQVAPNLTDRDKGLRKISVAAEDIEEIKTLFLLRKKTLELHLGFSIADRFSSSGQSAMTSQDT